MTITNGYCTLAEYKSWNSITTTNATDDTVIEDIIESVSRQIDGICGRHFFVTTAIARYFKADHGGQDMLFIDDLSSITSLAIVSDDDGDGTYENTWTSSDYNVMPYQPQNSGPYTMIETSPQGDFVFSAQKKGNKITGLWGWAAVPDDVKVACLIMVDAEYHARDGQSLSTTTSITPAGIVLTPAGVPKTAMDKLRPYIRNFI
jgi:hypothetical protein